MEHGQSLRENNTPLVRSSKMFNTVAAHVVSLVFLTFVVWLVPSCILSVAVYLAAFLSFLYVSYLLASVVDNLLPRFRVTSDKKAVLITGCDRGFGQLLARRLDSIGFTVFAGCLDPASKDTAKLIGSSSKNLHVFQLDVTRDDSVENALKMVENNLGNNELWAVVNNAGVIERGELEWTPMEAFRKQFEVNTFGMVRVTKAFLPLLRKSKGRVVSVTSTGGRITFSGFVPYCMSKYAANSFCDGLRQEMKKFGVKVITIEPISYKTSMTDMSTVIESAKKNWSSAPDHLKRDVYDSDYIRAFTEVLQKFNDSTRNPQVHQVIDWMVEGVAAISPHYSYVPGDCKSLLNRWAVQRIPTTFADYFIRKTTTFDWDLEQYLKNKMAAKKEK